MSNGERYETGAGAGAWPLRILVALVITAVGVGSVFVKGCQTGPFGRHQVVGLNPQQEAALGVQAYDEVLTKSEVIRSGAVVDAVNGVFDRLRDAAGGQRFLEASRLKFQKMDWQCRVVQSKEVNAFCLPGGKIVVYTSILPICETDAGLATVMGHEIGHALAHHGAERMAQQQMVQAVMAGAGTSMADMNDEQRQRVLQVLNAGAQVGILRYSRQHESEADHLGLLLMAAAGYDPNQAIKFWERMEKLAGGSRTPEFLSTHPTHQTRIHDLMDWIPQAMPLYEASGRTTRPQLLPLGR